MKKLVSGFLTLVLALVSFVVLSFATVVPASASTEVKFCHATGQGKKYELKTETDKAGIVNGHAGESHQGGLDIIPPFTYEEKVNGVRTLQYFAGQELDKLHLIDKGCVADADVVSVSPESPEYIPASCKYPEFPYGQLVIPSDLGNGVASAVDNGRSGDNTIWSATYTLKTNDDDHSYTWKAPRTDGLFTFNVVPITTDDLWIVDSATGKGSCKMPDTGAGGGISQNTILLAGGLIFAGMLFLGGSTFINRRKS